MTDAELLRGTATELVAWMEDCPEATLQEEILLVARTVPMLLDRLAAAEAAGAWRDIATAPKDGTPVLAWCPKAYRGTGGHYVALWQDDAWWAAVHAFKFEPTHWLPLPPAPKETP